MDPVTLIIAICGLAAAEVPAGTPQPCESFRYGVASFGACDKAQPALRDELLATLRERYPSARSSGYTCSTRG